MGMLGTMSRLNTNVQSMRSRSSLNRINKKISANQRKMATGRRINKAEDNAAGLSIATKLASRVSGLQQSLNNIGDAQSVLNIADKSYQETNDLLVELKQLSTQAASDTIGDVERGYIGEKITALSNQINEVANQSVFQGTELLNGRLDPDTGEPKYIQERSLTFQTGERSQDVTNVDLKAVSVNELFPERVRDNGELMPDMDYRVNEIEVTVGGNTTTISGKPGHTQSLLNDYFEDPKKFVEAINDGGISGVSAAMDGSDITFTNENTDPVEITYFDSRDSLPVQSTINIGPASDASTPNEKTVDMHLHDKEWPVDTVFIQNDDNDDFKKYGIDSYTVDDLTKLFHDDLNMEHIKVIKEGDEIKLENTHLYDEEVIKLGVEDPGTGNIIAQSEEQTLPKAVIPENVQGEIDTSGWPPSEYRVFSREVDDAISRMADRLNTLGATQHSLSSQEQTVVQSITSNKSAKSRIMDTDFAKAQSESVRLQILQQTATSALAQANNGPQSVFGFIDG